jgi:hypothetical protein
MMLYTRRDSLAVAALGAFGVSAVLARSTAESDGALTLDQIIARHTKARGGAAAIDAINSQKSTVEITENSAVMAGIYRATKAPLCRVDVYVGKKHVYAEGLDDDGVWNWPSDEPKPLQSVADAKKTLIQGVELNLYGLHAFSSLGNKLSASGREKIEGIDYYVVEVEFKDSYKTFLYVDPQTWMITRRREIRAFHPDLDTTKKFVETQYSDFRPFGGVLSAVLSHMVNLKTGEITQVAVTKTLVYNAPEDRGVFARDYKSP